MLVLKLLAGPLIGALIGYFTNYIAVKMLFRPHHPVMLGSHRLPFTPGLIPKRKDELAGAIGKAISDVLLTKDDLTKAFPAESIKKTIADEIWNAVEQMQTNKKPLGVLAQEYIPEDEFNILMVRLEQLLTQKLTDAVQRINISRMVVEEGSKIILEKVQGTMLAMMLNEQMIAAMAEPIGESIETYVQENGKDRVRIIVHDELLRLEDMPMSRLLEKLPQERQVLDRLVDVLYDSCIEDSIAKMMDRVNIAEIVEEKIKEMDVAALEELILSVMKKELNAIVNLGALIGLVIGLLNMLISLL